MLDTSTVILLGEIADPTALADESVISAITLAELSVGPHVARSDDERSARQQHLQQAEADLGESEPEIGAGSQGDRAIITAGARACAVVTVVLAGFAAVPAAAARPSDPGVVNYAVLGKESVGNIVGATMGWEDMSTVPVQDYRVDLPVCNNYADIGLPEVYNDPGLASFNSAVMQESPTDETHYVKQAVGVFATNDATNGAFHRILDRTGGCSGQTTPMHIDNGTTQVWSFTNGVITGTDAAWSKQEAGTDRRCFIQTRLRENVLLQAKVCESGDGGPAVNALAGAMQNALGQ